MPNPPNLNYCKITGNFKAFIADNQDADDLPDFVPMSGTGQIWPNVTTTKNTAVGYKSTYFNSPISIIVDADGDLSQGGRKYVMVLAESETLNPATFNYSIMLDLYAQGEGGSRVYGPFAFDIVPGGEVDITDVLPVSAYGGNPIVQGPQGIQGPIGVQGPPVNLTVGETMTGASTPGTPGPQGPQGVQGIAGGFVVSTNINAGTSLDTITTPGLYLNTTANAAAAPSNTSGHLEVISGASWILQRFTVLSEQRVYWMRRRDSGSAWGPWVTYQSNRFDTAGGRALYTYDWANNRDQRIYGDTGIRNLTLDNGFVGALTLRRYNDTVSLAGAIKRPPGGSLNGTFLTSVPVGFAPASSVWTYTMVRHSGNAAGFWLYRKNTELTFIESVPGNETDAVEVRFEVSWTTTQNWPSVLPGTAIGAIPNL